MHVREWGTLFFTTGSTPVCEYRGNISSRIFSNSEVDASEIVVIVVSGSCHQNPVYLKS